MAAEKKTAARKTAARMTAARMTAAGKTPRNNRSPELRYITRYDYQGRHGWWVRIQRRLTRGSKPLVISEFFSDDKNGGAEQGLVKAQAFRDGAITTAPAVRQQKHVPDGTRRGYGYTRVEGGVARGWFRDDRGKIHRFTASVSRWGLAEAEKRVREWLDGKTKGGVQERT